MLIIVETLHGGIRFNRVIKDTWLKLISKNKVPILMLHTVFEHILGNLYDHGYYYFVYSAFSRYFAKDESRGLLQSENLWWVIGEPDHRTSDISIPYCTKNVLP